MIGLTLAVCALWVCFAMERITTQHADTELRASLRTIQRLRSTGGNPGVSQPVSRPFTPSPQHSASA
jgi:hypothetical protein